MTAQPSFWKAWAVSIDKPERPEQNRRKENFTVLVCEPAFDFLKKSSFVSFPETVGALSSSSPPMQFPCDGLSLGQKQMKDTYSETVCPLIPDFPQWTNYWCIHCSPCITVTKRPLLVRLLIVGECQGGSLAWYDQFPCKSPNIYFL